MVKSACEIEAVYMCFNGTGIWGGETIIVLSARFNMVHILPLTDTPEDRQKIRLCQ